MVKTLDEIKEKKSTVYQLIIVMLIFDRGLFGDLDADQYNIVQVVMLSSLIFGVLAGLRVKNKIKPIVILSALTVLMTVITLLILSVPNGHFYNFSTYFGSAVLSWLIFIISSSGISFIKNEQKSPKQSTNSQPSEG